MTLTYTLNVNDLPNEPWMLVCNKNVYMCKRLRVSVSVYNVCARTWICVQHVKAFLISPYWLVDYEIAQVPSPINNK